MSFAYGFGLPHWQSLSGGAFSPAQLFQGGVQGAWYDPSDSATVFEDRAGTTPCRTPGAGAGPIPVGAMLDERAPGYSVYFDGTGDYLSVANSASLNAFGDFTIEFWINFSAVANNLVILGKGYQYGLLAPYLFFVNNTTLNFYASSNGSSFNVASAANVIASVSTSQWYHVVVCRSGSTLSTFNNGTRVTTITNNSVLYTNAGALTLMSDTLGAASANGYISNLRVVKGVAVYDPTQSTLTVPTSPLSPISGTSLLTCGTSWSGNPAITVNGDARVDGLNPFQASPVGNHAVGTTTTTTWPTLSARVNLLTYSEDFSNAAWTKQDTAGAPVITLNQGIAPDGTNTANKIAFPAIAAAGDYSQILQNLTLSAATYKGSIYLKAFSAGDVGKKINVFLYDTARQNLQTVTLTSDWQLVSSTSALSAGSSRSLVFGVYGASFSGSNQGAVSALVWGADLRPANIGTTIPAYQRVADQYTYDTVGFPRYLAANGTSSAMSTPNNVNLSGTDKVTVFAGVRVTQEIAANTQVLCELSSSVANSGSFELDAMVSDGSSKLGDNRFRSNGTNISSALNTTLTSAPRSAVLTGLANISADSVILRSNGVQVATSATDQGTGNYGTYPLFIGARNNASLWLTGNIYSLIVAGSAVSAANITATEQWVAGKTGITI